MFFGRKKNKNSVEPINVAVESMPTEFLGGVNPVVSFKTAAPSGTSAVLSAVDKKAFDKTTAVGAKNKIHFANLLQNKKFVIIISAALFVVFLIVASIYYFYPVIFGKNKLALNNNAATPTTIPASTPPADVLPSNDELVATEPAGVVTGSSTEDSVVPDNGIKIDPADTVIDYPSPLLSDSADFDKDDVSDVAEELYLTDPGVPDSDGDKYEDGHEIYNLYNPVGKNPQKLIDSGLVVEYVNPVFNYRLYYPKNWAVGNVDENYRDVLFSTLTGENIEVRVYDLVSGDTLSGWMAKMAPGEQVQNLLDFETAFSGLGKRRSDYLVYYFVEGGHVFVVAYHNAPGSETINYRMVIKMLARSLRVSMAEPVLSVEQINESGGLDSTSPIPL